MAPSKKAITTAAKAKPAVGKKPAAPKTAAARKTTKPQAKPAVAKAAVSDFANDALLETANEQVQGYNEMMRQFAESGMEQSRAALDGLRDAADMATFSFEESSDVTRAAGEKIVSVYLDALSANTNAVLETAQALGGAGTMAGFLEIWTDQSRKQIDTMTRQNEELSTAISHYLNSAAKPVTDSIAKGFAP